jgi:hypothetical protein
MTILQVKIKVYRDMKASIEIGIGFPSNLVRTEVEGPSERLRIGETAGEERVDSK